MSTPSETDDLPILFEDYPLTEEQILAYRRDGHLLLRGVASPEEVGAYRPHIRKVVETVTRKRDPQGRIDDYGSLFTQVTNVWRQSPAAQRFVFSRRFAHIAARLLGVAGVRLYHDQALFKEPGSHRTPWHQDAYYWPLDTDRALTMWMPLVDVSMEMGPMIFATGSHQPADLGHLPISEEVDERLARFIAESALPCASEPVAAGDATFHSSRTLHSAHPNRSGAVREVMTVIYFADGTRLLPPDNPHRQVDMEVFVPGGRPGDLAASPLNPLLYRE